VPAAVRLQGVSKSFRFRAQRATTLKSAVLDAVGRRRPGGAERFVALRDVTLEVGAGRSLGVIGRNGSGKSTLLRLIAGIYRPDAGRVRVDGRVAALIELGAGFHPEFSGRENVLLNALVLGLSRRDVARKLDEIVAFSGLAAFIDQPTRTYSTGMYMRLGFSVAVHVDPEVLLVDEVLAVGDAEFQKRCHDRLAELRRRGTTLVIVTHDPAAVERWCDEAVWLDGGAVRAAGSPRTVLDHYQDAVVREESAALAAMHERPGEGARRWGRGDVRIEGVTLRGAGAGARYVFESGEPLTATLRYRVERPAPAPVFGFAVMRADGFCVYGGNTELAGVALPALGRTGEVSVTFDRLDLVGGSYFLDVAVNSREGVVYDYHGRHYPFAVRSRPGELGVARLPHRWGVRPD